MNYFVKTMIARLAEREPIEHSRLANYIRTRISIGIIRYICMCVRGNRSFRSGESLLEFE